MIIYILNDFDVIIPIKNIGNNKNIIFIGFEQISKNTTNNIYF
jgi:hypothetical protein